MALQINDRSMTKYEVASDQNGVRIDVYLAENTEDCTRSQTQKYIRGGQVMINGKKQTKTGYLVAEGDIIEVDIQALEESRKLKKYQYELDIVYEDEDLIVVNKPKGLVVHPAAGHPDDTLANALLQHTKTPYLVHRLDKDTTGIIIAATSIEMQESMQKQFKERTIKKTYVALVRGFVDPPSGMIDAPITRHQTDRKRMAVRQTSKSKSAQTAYVQKAKYIYKDHKYSLLELDLMTGRTHQIRVHTSAIDHPIVGDKEYGNKQENTFIKEEFGLESQFLHAQSIQFAHPQTGRKIQLKADLPEELQMILDEFQKSTQK